MRLSAWESHDAMQAGLVDPPAAASGLTSAWSVVKAAGRAFPLLLHKSIEKAESLVPFDEWKNHRESDRCLRAWAEQVTSLERQIAGWVG